MRYIYYTIIDTSPRPCIRLLAEHTVFHENFTLKHKLISFIFFTLTRLELENVIEVETVATSAKSMKMKNYTTAIHRLKPDILVIS